MSDNSQAPPAQVRSGRLARLFGKSDQPSSETRSAKASPSTLELTDIQGFVVRGYRMPMVRHFLLSVGHAAHARGVLGRLINGDESDAPQITTAEDWHIGFEPGPADNLQAAPRRKPDYCLNVGITWSGMLALEIKDRVADLSFKSFRAFIEGAAPRSHLVGDTGPSAPENWVGYFGTGRDHVLITL